MNAPTKDDRLPSFVDLFLDAVFLVDIEGRIVYASAACEHIFGYAPDEMIGRSMIDFVAPEDRARTMREARQVIAGHRRIGFENRYVRKDGSHVHVMWSARWSEPDQLRVGVARDVTEQKHAEAMQAATYAISEAAHNAIDLDALLREIHRIIETLVPVAGFAIATCDPKTRKLSFTYQRDRHGNSPVVPEPIACQFCAKVLCSHGATPPHEDALAVWAVDAPSLSDNQGWLTMPLISRNESIGALVLKGEAGTIYTEKDKELLHFVSAQVAIAIERARLNAELLHAARHDELTGLPNRRLLLDRIESALARCARKHSHMAVLYLDIDDFKQVNDSLGHAVGDALLREVALRLKHCVRAADTVARLGGDEFAIVLEEVHTPAEVSAIADKIRNTIRQPTKIDGLVIETSASIGFALYPDDGTQTDQLLKRADDAMYVDKRT